MNDLKKSRWGVGIAVLYGSFVLFILAIIALASFQHFDMVEDHYYDKGLNYQQHIDKINRTNKLAERPKIEVDSPNHRITLTFPASTPSDKVTGNLDLYRPSGAVMDKIIPVKLDRDNRQQIPIEQLPSGFWKAKLEWQLGTDEYYLEESFFTK